MQAFIIRRYKDSSKEGSKAGIEKAENVGVILASGSPEAEDEAYQKAVKRLHGRLETILTKKTNTYGTRLYQQVVRQNSYSYFLEKANSLIV